jgi:XisI protein
VDDLDTYRRLIETILEEHTRIPYAYGDIQQEVVFDRIRDRYLVMNVGWDQGKRVHGSLIHVDIIAGKIWVQRDGTEDGIAAQLLEAGIPKDRIVLGFRAPEVRRDTGFAVA